MLNFPFNQFLFIAYLKHHRIDLNPMQRAAMLKYFKNNEGWCDIICNQFTAEDLLSNPEKIKDNLFISLLINKDYTPKHIIRNVIYNDIEKDNFFLDPEKAQEYINLIYSTNEAKETYDAVKEFLQSDNIQEKVQEIRKLMLKHDKTEKEEIICHFLKTKSSLEKLFENYKNSVHLLYAKQKEIPCHKQYLQDMIVYFKNNISQSNVLTDYFQYTLLVLFKTFPDSPLSWKEQKDLNSNDEKRSSDAFNKALGSMQTGDYFRVFFAEKKYGITTGGHSTLVYKSQDGTFTFFDPNNNIETKLSKEDVLAKVFALREVKMKAWNTAVNIGIMDNKKFLARHHSKRIKEIKSFIEKQNTHYLAKL